MEVVLFDNKYKQRNPNSNLTVASDSLTEIGITGTQLQGTSYRLSRQNFDTIENTKSGIV